MFHIDLRTVWYWVGWLLNECNDVGAEGMPFEPMIYWKKGTCEVNGSDHVDLQTALEVVDEVGYDFKLYMLQKDFSRFLDFRILKLKCHRSSALSDIIQFHKEGTDELMLMLDLFPVPALDLESPKGIFRSDQSA